MKVELDNVIIGLSPLTGNVMVGIPLKDGQAWRHKKDVTQSFLACVVQKWEDSSERIESGDNIWEITVVKIK